MEAAKIDFQDKTKAYNKLYKFFTKNFDISSIEQLNLIENEVIKFSNNTRLWILKGYTPEELSPTTVIKKEKVGRNDPCPCGSGKKYKNCCGKK